MKHVRAGIALLFLAGLFVPAALAAGITISSDRTDYYFGLGENAEIPLPVSNTFTHDIDGTLRFTITGQLQNTGTVMISTQDRVYSREVPPGNSFINLSAGTSNVPKTVKVDVAYQYTDSSPVEVTLPQLIIHFVQDPSQAAQPQGGQNAVASTSGNASSAFGSSSVRIVQQSVSAQQQAGRDSLPFPAGQSQQWALQNNQIPQDTEALKGQLRQETTQKAEDKEEFAQRLAADPLVRKVNETLARDGFGRVSLDTSPAGGNEGTFTMTYLNAAGDEVSLQGAMTDGVVPSVLEQSAADVSLSAPLAANTTYQSFAGRLAGQGFAVNTTVMNVTLGGATANITYVSGQGVPAYINATTDGGNVTAVSLAIGPEKPADLLPVAAAAALALLALAAWLIYRRWKAQRAARAGAALPSRPAPAPFDFREEALRLLEEAQKAFARQEYPDAYGLAGRAARIWCSYRAGDGRELTNDEVIRLIGTPELSGQSGAIAAMLGRCSDVEFARGLPDAEEFGEMIRSLRETVTGK